MNFSVCILTGGKSSRMGTNKSHLYLRGETLENRLFKIAIQFSDDVFVAGSSTGNRFYSDEQGNKGPLSGIQTALTNAKHEWILVIACDMPLFSKDLLYWLSDEFKSLDNEKIAFVSTERDHYLVGFYHKSILEKVNQYLEIDELRVKELIEDGNFKKLLAPQALERSLLNINTPKDLDTFGLMKVKIIAFGQIEEILGNKEMDWLTDQVDISGLKNELESSYPQLQNISYRFAVNESLVDNINLSMDDTIALLPPFAGG